MKKYLVLPILMLSCQSFAIVPEEKVAAMRTEVKSMSETEVITKDLELFDVVQADPTEQHCEAFGVFHIAARKEKKIKLMDMEAQNRLFAAQNTCDTIF